MEQEQTKITILGEVWERKDIPNVAKMLDANKENAEHQIQSIADAWHGGSIVSAVQALESDLAHR